MAFPQVATSNSGDTASLNQTTHTLNMPASISSGDLIVMMFAVDGDITTSWPAGWVTLVDDSNAGGTQTTLAVRYRIADGTEGATIDVDSSASEQSAHVSYRINAWHGTTPPEVDIAGANTANPDPPSVTASWGSDDNLWIAGTGYNDGRTVVTAYPTDYVSNQLNPAVGAGGTGVGVATDEVATNTEDPATFTIDNGEVQTAFTIVVRPAAAVGGGNPWYYFAQQ